MIDTIRLQASVTVDPTSVERLRSGEVPDWRFRSEEIDTNGRRVSDPHRQRLTYLPVDLRIGTDSLFLKSIEVSVPRLLGGSNGILIKNPADLRDALRNLLFLVRMVCPRIEESHMEVTRLDLVLNLPLDPRMLLPLHRHARHRRIKRETELYHNEPTPHGRRSVPHVMGQLNCVRFQGTKTTISLYDKMAEQAGKHHHHSPGPSRSTRVEVQLRGRRHIAELLGLDEQVCLTLEQLEFASCYRAFRGIMLEFDPVGEVPQFKATIPNMLAILNLHPANWSSLGGMEPLEWYRLVNQVNDRQFRETRRQVHAAELTVTGFRWADHLPPDWLPDVVDIDHDGIETLVPSPWRLAPDPPNR